MFSAVLGLFSQDLAVDLGTSATRVHLSGSGVVCDEPSVVAVMDDRRGRRRVIAFGEEALPMVGRTPDDIRAIEPMKAGRVVDFEVAEALLLHMVRRIHGRNGWMRPRMVVTVPFGASDMELRAVRDSCEAAGARAVHLVPRPLAAALGAGLPVHEPSGHLVVDLGAGATEISMLSLSGVVNCTALETGGRTMDEAIIAWCKKAHALLVGRPSAERVKHELGAAHVPDPSKTMWVKGRCLRNGTPHAVKITARGVYDALGPSIDLIAQGIRKVLQDAPPELASDVVETGVVLVGGGALLQGLAEALKARTGLPIIVAENPTRAVIHGAGRVIEELDLREAMAS
jgi:rod shape-determining protein MreB and related proteins